ncbi:hypothetical protein ACI65C_007368 [Semiaphis heraclei]
MVNNKGTRKCLQTLQPSGGVDKENLVGTGRFHEQKPGPKTLKPQFETEVDAKSEENKSVDAKSKSSLYKKLIIEGLNNTVGPSTSVKYWEVIAERRRKALEEVLEQNSKLHALIMALEEENSSCKKTLEQTTNLLNTLTEVSNEKYDKSAEDSVDNDISPIKSNDFSGNKSE